LYKVIIFLTKFLNILLNLFIFKILLYEIFFKRNLLFIIIYFPIKLRFHFKNKKVHPISGCYVTIAIIVPEKAAC
jgi:hypothetical protein